ncbi:MAG: tyrosine-type recombinase/integrase [Myxococcales bacterium]|nr:tyrosine-type recombinase/integrase [Myxococcales bacterium]
MTEAEAKTLAWNLYLKHEQRGPSATCTLADFYREQFVPNRLRTLKKGSQADYETRWRNWVEPLLGNHSLHKVSAADVQAAVFAVLRAGRSAQTARHVQKLVQAIFSYAEQIGWYSGRNPGSRLDIPDHAPEYEPPTLTKDQLRLVLDGLDTPLREMVLLAAATSLTCAEMRGLRWKRVNLTAESIPSGRHMLPPRSLLVLENYYLGEYTTVKAKKRRRIVPLPTPLVRALVGLQARTAWTGPEDPVFAARSGSPIDTHNATNRKFRKLSRELGFKIGWHGLRNTHATLLNAETELSVFDRMAQLGHASATMTDRYTVTDVERRRAAVERAMDGLLSPSDETIN